MIYLDTQPKTHVTFRLSPDLLELIKNEAGTQKKTVSAYLEQVVLQRVDGDVDVPDLKNRLFQLEAENHELRKEFQEKTVVHGDVHVHLAEKAAEIRALKQEKMELQTMLRQTSAERTAISRAQTSALPYWLSEHGHEVLSAELRTLQAEFPRRTFETLLIDSLRVARKNLDPFTYSVNTLKNFPSFSPNASKSKIQ